jgi:hypothetical protein
MVDQATGELTRSSVERTAKLHPLWPGVVTVTVGLAPVGDRLQVLSKSWPRNRFRSFSVLLSYPADPLRA